MPGDVWIQFPPVVLQVMQKAGQVGRAVRTLGLVQESLCSAPPCELCQAPRSRWCAHHHWVWTKPVPARALHCQGRCINLGFWGQGRRQKSLVRQPDFRSSGTSLGSTSGPLWGALQTVTYSNLMEGRLFSLRWISLSTDQELNSSFQPCGSSESRLDL